jgi:predicted small integral membrane protein
MSTLLPHSTPDMLRLSKVMLVASAAVFATLVVFNNLTDYGSNFAYVHHVLSMDTTFPDNAGKWRAIDSAMATHLAYGFIIVVEAVIAVLGWMATARLWQRRRDQAGFAGAKVPAIAALTLGVVLWFTGFIAGGGEWFLSWQSPTWNGLNESARFSMIYLLILIYVVQPERDA